MGFFNSYIDFSFISEAENQRIENENFRIINENNRINSGALIKSGDTMTGALNLNDVYGLVLGNKYRLKYNKILDAIEIERI